MLYIENVIVSDIRPSKLFKKEQYQLTKYSIDWIGGLFGVHVLERRIVDSVRRERDTDGSKASNVVFGQFDSLFDGGADFGMKSEKHASAPE